MKKKILLAMFAFIGLLVGVLCSNDVYAEIDTSPIVKKWVFTQYYNCMNPSGANAMNAEITPKRGDIKVADSIMNEGVGEIYMPSFNFGNLLNNSPIDCLKLFNGASNSPGVLDPYNSNYVDTTWSEGVNGSADSLLKTTGYLFVENDPSNQIGIIGSIIIKAKSKLFTRYKL